jgi:hypothetical protein
MKKIELIQLIENIVKKQLKEHNQNTIAILDMKDRIDVATFKKQYEKIYDWMSLYVKTSNILNDYKAFLTAKDRLENEGNKNVDSQAYKKLVTLGYTPENINSKSFGSRTFFKIKFPGKLGYAAIFQVLHDLKFNN